MQIIADQPAAHQKQLLQMLSVLVKGQNPHPHGLEVSSQHLHTIPSPHNPQSSLVDRSIVVSAESAVNLPNKHNFAMQWFQQRKSSLKPSHNIQTMFQGPTYLFNSYKCFQQFFTTWKEFFRPKSLHKHWFSRSTGLQWSGTCSSLPSASS